MKIDDLKDSSYNPRTITDESLKSLKFSMEEFGDLSGLVFNKATGNLVAGHQRLRGLKEKFGKKLRMVKQKDAERPQAVITPSGDRFPVRVVEWDLTKEKAANLAANNPHLTGEFTSAVIGMIEELEVDAEQLSVDIRLSDLAKDYFSNIETEEGVTDPYGEWEGMPEFAQQDLSAYRTIIVHIMSEEALKDFLAKIGRTIGEKTKFIFYPEQERDEVSDLAYE
jgi:hypothetical protein